MPPKWFTVSFAGLGDSEVDCLCLGLFVEFVVGGGGGTVVMVRCLDISGILCCLVLVM